MQKENRIAVMVEIESSNEIIMFHFDAHHSATFPAPFESLDESGLT